jgi:YVTN family beta-propeller protein
VALAASCAGLAGVAIRADTLLVAVKSDFKLALVDPATNKVIAKVPTDQGPHEIAVTPDQRYAYVSNYGVYEVFPPGNQTHDKTGNTVTVVDLAHHTVKKTLHFGTHTGPHSMAFSHDGKLLWMTAETPPMLLEIDVATGKILRSWETHQERTHLIVVMPDEKKIYLTNTISGTLTVLNRETGGQKVIATGPRSEGICMSPDGREVWVADRGDSVIRVISTASDEIVDSFPSGGKSPLRMRFTPDGKEVWISNVDGKQVSVFDAASRKLLTTIGVDGGPQGMVFSADGKRGYFAVSNANQVTIMDVPGRKVLGTIDVGTEPDGMAWARTH